MTTKKDPLLDDIQPLTTLDIDSLINLSPLKIDDSFLSSNIINTASINGIYRGGAALPQGSINLTTASSTNPYFTQSSDLIFGTNTNTPKVHLNQEGIQMDSDCDLKIGDFSVKESLERIEKQLGILKVNPELEQDWEELKELGERYRELEKNIKDKLNVWTILKKT